MGGARSDATSMGELAYFIEQHQAVSGGEQSELPRAMNIGLSR